MWTLAFWKATFERVLASFLGAIAATWTSTGIGVTSLDFAQMLNIGAGAALFSLIKAVLAAVSTDGSPSMTNAEVLADKVAAKAVPNDKVATDTPELVAGPAANVPENSPVAVVPANEVPNPADAAGEGNQP